MRNFLTGRSEPKQDKNATVEQRMSVMIKNEDILGANQLWENIQYTEQSGKKVNAGDIETIQKNVIDQNLDMDIILQQQLINKSPSLRMEYQESMDQWPSTQQSYNKELWQQLPCCIQHQIIDKIKENEKEGENNYSTTLINDAHPNAKEIFENTQSNSDAWTNASQAFHRLTGTHLKKHHPNENENKDQTKSANNIKNDVILHEEFIEKFKDLSSQEQLAALNACRENYKNEPAKMEKIFTKMFIEANPEAQMNYFRRCNLSIEEKDRLLRALHDDIEEKKEKPAAVYLRTILTALPIVITIASLIIAPPASPLVYISSIIGAVAASKLIEGIYHSVAGLMASDPRRKAHFERAIEAFRTIFMMGAGVTFGIIVAPILPAAALSTIAILSVTSLLAVTGHYCNQASKALMKKQGILPKIASIFLKVLSNTIGSPRFLFRFLITLFPRKSSTQSTENRIYEMLSRGLSIILYAPARPIVEACTAYKSVQDYNKQQVRKVACQTMLHSVLDNDLAQQNNQPNFEINKIKAGLGGPSTIDQSNKALKQLRQVISDSRNTSIKVADKSRNNQEINSKSIQSQNTPPRRP